MKLRAPKKKAPRAPRAKRNPTAAPLPVGIFPSEVTEARAAYDHGYRDALLLHAHAAKQGMTNAMVKYGSGARATAYFWGFWHAIATGASTPRRKNPKASAETDYSATHGGLEGDFDRKRVRVPDPRAGELVVLGPLKRVEYITDKGEGESIYHHDFGREFTGAEERGRVKPSRRPYLAFNREGLVIAGGSYRVQPEGIVG